MTAPAFFEETQSFPPWLYALLALALALLASLLFLRQTTAVAPDAVTVRFGPWYRMRIPISEIVRAESISYRPVRDFGGWGIRGLGKRRALTTRGREGVLITRADGSTVLVGSQRPRELLQALAQVGVRTEDRLPIVVREF